MKGSLFKKIFLLICIIVSIVKASGQTINLKEINAPLETVFKDIQKQTNYSFVYTTQLLKKANTVNIEFTNTPLNDALQQVFSGQSLGYTIYNKMVIVKEKSETTQQTYTISGTVTDEKGQPIPGATVFLTNTKMATATDGLGKFLLNGIISGPYEIVVKMLGFTPNIQLIKVENNSVTINVKLKETSITLNAVTINAKPDSKRKEYMELFIKNFIGESTNAGLCKLLNPDVLNFHYDKKTNVLTASADDFLIIENNGLGYRLKYLLKYFKLNLGTNVSDYSGSPYFEELSGTYEQQKRWEQSRRVAYLGSCRHFFRAVINNTAPAEGFAMYDSRQSKDPGNFKFKQFDSLFINNSNNLKSLISKSIIRILGKDTTRLELYVVYRFKRQLPLFYRTGQPSGLHSMGLPLGQLSSIHILADTILIDKELLLNPTKNLSFYGYWGWEKIAEYLPLDYFVDPLAEEKK